MNLLIMQHRESLILSDDTNPLKGFVSHPPDTMYHAAMHAENETEIETDEMIAAAVQKGDTEIFGGLVRRYEKKLLRYGTKFLSNQGDIENIVQDVFLSAYQNIKGFDTRQRFSPWIYRIAHNAFVNELRKTTRRPLLPFDFDELVSYTVYEDPVTEGREKNEMLAMINQSIEKVSPKYKEVLILHYVEGLSCKDIADVIQVPIGTVCVRLKRAKEAVRAQLKTTYGE